MTIRFTLAYSWLCLGNVFLLIIVDNSARAASALTMSPVAVRSPGVVVAALAAVTSLRALPSAGRSSPLSTTRPRTSLVTQTPDQQPADPIRSLMEQLPD